jgi:hypothetical protein
MKATETLTETFTLRISPEDRKELTKLARRMHRSESDTIRFVVHEASKAFQDEAKRIADSYIDPSKQKRSHVGD